MRRRGRGQAMVEFSLVLGIMLTLILGGMDLFRAYQAVTTVASAARQAARQGAADGVSTDDPWGSVSGSCIGTDLVQNANGTGCLTDQALFNTAQRVMGAFGSNLTLKPNVDATTCNSLALGAGAGFVCINPVASGNAKAGNCASVGLNPFAGGEQDRQTEWIQNTYLGCYFVQVTVVYAYVPITPIVRNLIGGGSGFVKLSSTSTVLAEY